MDSTRPGGQGRVWPVELAQRNFEDAQLTPGRDRLNVNGLMAGVSELLVTRAATAALEAVLPECPETIQGHRARLKFSDEYR
jgi:hypothetical protein